MRAYYEYLCDLFWEEKNKKSFSGEISLSELFELRKDSDESMAKKLFVKNMEFVASLLESAGKKMVAENVLFYSFHINDLNTFVEV